MKQPRAKNTQHNNMNWVKSRYKRRRSENRLEESRLSIVKENSVGGSQAQKRRSRSPGRRASDKPGAHGRRQDRRESDAQVAETTSGPWSLEPEAFPWLTKLGRNLE